MIKNLRYECLNPVSDCTKNAFDGEVQFAFNPSMYTIVDYASAFINIKYELTHYTGVGAAYTPTPMPADYKIINSQNGFFFKSGSISMADKIVSQCNDYGLVVHYDTILTQSPQKVINNGSVNPINLPRRWSISDQHASPITFGFRNNENLNLTPINTNYISGCHTLPFFKTKNENSEIHGSIKTNINLQVNNNYENNILFRNTVNAGFRGVYKNGNVPSFVVGNTYISVSVSEITLNLLMHDSNHAPKQGIVYKKYHDYYSTTSQISLSREIIRIVSPQAVDIMAAVVPTNSNIITQTPTVFIDGEIYSGNAMLSSYVLYNDNESHPLVPYNLKLLATDDDRVDNSKAYKEFINLSSHLNGNNGSVFDLLSYLSNFIIYHPLPRLSNDRVNNLKLHLEFRGSPLNSAIFIMSRLQKRLVIEYNNDGHVIDIKYENEV